MRSLIESLLSLPELERRALILSLTEEQARELQWDWRLWARPNQLPPDGDWRTWFVNAGRGFGKTRCGAEWVRSMMCGTTPLARGELARIALIGLTAADARDVMVEGESGLLAVHPAEFRPLYEPSKRRLTWPNGAVATCYNASEPDQLRGPQFDGGWVDEFAKFPHAQDLWDQYQFALRLGEKPRTVVTTTPRPTPAVKRLLAQAGTVVTHGRTLDNAANLAPGFVAELTERYGGTRLGRQELDAEMVDDVPGALWTRAMLDTARVSKLPDMARVVVAIDPSGTDGADDGDDIGIVVAGRGVDGRGYVLADDTCKLSPDGWARRAITAYHRHEADRLVAERNFGGAMVQAVIRAADRSVPFKEVTASRGKVARAEPISALYEQGRVSHVAGMTALEDEMVLMTAAGFAGEGSPNRVDALVWALTEVMLTHVRPEPDATSWSIPSMARRAA